MATLTILKASLDTDLLISVVTLDQLPAAATIHAVTEAQIKAWIAAKDEVKLEAMSIDELKTTVLSGYRMNLMSLTPPLRVIGLFTDYQTLLRSKNLGDLTKSNPKLAVGNICKLLKPAALRSRIENDLEVGKK